MAWTQADLDKIDIALSSNVRKVTFADGRSTEFQNADQMLAVRREIKAELLASASQITPRVRTVVARMHRPCH
ncbi:phage head-tail joining protein [Sphingobium sp. RAC03]|uniref:phage head-tail joining protein n=1 Tax=Sphingobium sp. RAC03 TaxID=1843368 RepID=UPI00083DAFA4|nr:hypothetical protein [Sphingobium sp. RAC03]AOF95742.1 hypothetical protein BSY17_2651 [Sphingobium sp. RAC03]